MSAEEPKPWSLAATGILIHPQQPRLWAQETAGGLELPHFTYTGEQWPDQSIVRDHFEAILQRPLNLLRRAFFEEDEAAQYVQALYVLEAAGEETEMAGSGRWLAADELHLLQIEELYRPVVAQVLQEMEMGEVPALRVPWARQGWNATLEGWIDEQLVAAGLRRQGRLQPLKVWELSAVLRVPTDQGDYFFKAVNPYLPLFVNEAVILKALAALYPQNIPTPLAIDAAREWMLLPDAGQFIGWEASLEQQKGMLGTFAAIQMDAAGRVDELLAAGCLDRRLEVLATQIEPLLQHPAVARHLSEEQVQRLHSLTTTLKETCVQLAGYDIPQTLAHGDLHGGNVTYCDGQYMMIDWTDACITHPFIDMINIRHHSDEEERAQLRDHYLAQWQGFETATRLREAWELAQPLMSLHQAVSYLAIADNLEPQAGSSMLGWAIPYWLGGLLKHYEERAT